MIEDKIGWKWVSENERHWNEALRPPQDGKAVLKEIGHNRNTRAPMDPILIMVRWVLHIFSL